MGVSEATVSRVLNGKPGVAEHTRQAVLTALDVLGYERPVKLRGDRGRLVGMMMPELSNPIFPAFAELIGGALIQQGLTPVLCTNTAVGVSEADYVDILLAQQVSGIVFAGGAYSQAEAQHEHYRTLVDRQLPAVLINASFDGIPFPRVACDDKVAMELALAHLLSLGHARIGLLLGPADHVPSQRKLAAALEVAGTGVFDLPERRVIRAAYSLESGAAGMTRLLREDVTAVVCASDPLALGAIRSVRRAGLTVPGDVSVVGFDDSPLMTCTDPPLTTVRQPIEPMARAAIDLLVAQIDGTTVLLDELLFEPELVVRGSTAPAR